MERSLTSMRKRPPIAIPNQRCKAVKRNGEKCRAWAVRGAVVCVAHGGAAPQVRRAAAVRVSAAEARAEMERAAARYQRDLERWQRRRVALTAELMDIRPDRVTAADVTTAVILHGDRFPRRPEITDRKYLPRSVRRPSVIRGEVIKNENGE